MRYYVNEGSSVYSPVVSQCDDELHWFHSDALGSTVGLTDGAAGQTDTFLYEAFGTSLGRTGTTVTPMTFVGSAGLYADPTVGVYDHWGVPYFPASDLTAGATRGARRPSAYPSIGPAPYRGPVIRAATDDESDGCGDVHRTKRHLAIESRIKRLGKCTAECADETARGCLAALGLSASICAVTCAAAPEICPLCLEWMDFVVASACIPEAINMGWCIGYCYVTGETPPDYPLPPFVPIFPTPTPVPVPVPVPIRAPVHVPVG